MEWTPLTWTFDYKEVAAFTAMLWAVTDLWGGINGAAHLSSLRIDRSPGRIIAMCVEGWKALNRTVFALSPSYLSTRIQLAGDDEKCV